MKKIFLIIWAFITFACSSSNRKIPEGVETIYVENHKISHNASSFFEKIELVPLETNDSSLFYRSNKVIYDKAMDMYAIYTSDQIVYTFTGDGRFIDNSKRRNGQGPNDYIMVLDINFNPYLKGIDMLNPYGTIYTYSPKFELLSRKQFKPNFPIDYLMAVDSNNYVFNHPFIWTDQELSFVNMKTQQIINNNYEGTISGNTLSHECFYHIGDQFYFVPIGVNYYFYQIDVKEKRLIPIMYLDFGDLEIQVDDLPGRAVGKRTDSDDERHEITREAMARYKYLRESDNSLPMLKFFNDDFVYVHFVKTSRGYGSHFIYNRKNKESFLIKDGKPFLIYPCFGIVDNILLAICQPDIVSKFVNHNLMTPKEILKMEQLKEDDNPVIIKYYLKQ